MTPTHLPIPVAPPCDHNHAETFTQVLRLHNAANEDSPFYTVSLKVQCSECGVAFRFLGDNAGVPQTAEEAIIRRLGCWTSDMGDELGALIHPFGASGALETVPVLGRA